MTTVDRNAQGAPRDWLKRDLTTLAKSRPSKNRRPTGAGVADLLECCTEHVHACLGLHLALDGGVSLVAPFLASGTIPVSVEVFLSHRSHPALD